MKAYAVMNRKKIVEDNGTLLIYKTAKAAQEDIDFTSRTGERIAKVEITEEVEE